MVRVIYKAIFTMLGAIACNLTQADMGVAYSPWQPGKIVTEDILVKELTIVALNFSVIRTFHAVMNEISIVKVASQVGLQIDVGIYMIDEANIASEIEAVCVAYKSYGETIRTVYVGNENLKNGEFGTVEHQEIIKYIKQVKACVGPEVRVGTVQRVNEWLNAPGAEELVAECTACGANIHPYFADAASALSPIKMLQAQWGQIEKKYGDMSIWAVTETGWPTGGGNPYDRKLASVEIAQQYLNNVTVWSTAHTVIWFMFSDSLEAYNGMEVEKHFGLYDATCTNAKLTLPPKTNSGTTTSSYNPSPVISVSAPLPQQNEVGEDAQVTLVLSPTTPNPVTPEGELLEMDDPSTPVTQGKPVELHDVLNKGNKPVNLTGKDCTVEAP